MKQKTNEFEGARCPKCGAVMGADGLICAHCGYENVKKAEKIEEAGIQALMDEHAETLKKMPKELVRKNTGRLFLIIALAVLGIVLAVVMSVIFGRKNSADEYDAKEAMIAHLEELYQKGDYEQIQKDFYDSDYYGASFGKYANTSEIFYKSKYAIESLELARTSSSEHLRSPESLSPVLCKTVSCLKCCRKMRDEGFIYGEKTAVETMERRVYEALYEWGMTDEEIEDAINIYVDSKTDYTKLAKEIAERFKNRG